MNQRSLATLIAVNVILLASLVMVFFTTPQPAHAQFGAGGKYLMIAGRSPQRESQDVVYIIDVNTAKIITVIANTALRGNAVEVIAGKNIKPDLEKASEAKSGR